MGKLMIGSKSGKLTIINYSHSKNGKFWNVKCECGNEKIVSTSHFNQKQFYPKSCGCSLYPKDYKQLFLNNVNKTDSCWIWKGKIKSNGYGIFSIKKKENYAHRLSYLIHKGEIPSGKFICHSCDNPPCVNPDHLWLGDALSNNQDRIKKGRIRIKDIRKKNGVLTENQILEIRKIYRFNERGFGSGILSKKYGVTTETILSIVKRKSWKHI